MKTELKRMQNDLLSQCRDRVALTIASAKTGIDPLRFHRLRREMGYATVANCLPACTSQFYENHMRARHFMVEAVNWAGLQPPKGWLG